MNPIMLFEYRYTNDSLYNKNFNDEEGSFIGTQEQFDEFIEEQQKNYGMNYWDLKIRPATKEEMEIIRKFYGDDCFS